MKKRKPSAATHVIVLAGPFLALLCSLIAITEGNDVRFDWETRTGRYAWRRDYEAGGPYDDENPFGHGPVA